MSDLKSRLEAMRPPESRITVMGETFVVSGMSRSERSRMFADHRKKDGSVDGPSLEGALLCRCVCDADGCPVCSDSPSWWDNLPAAITAPLIQEIMRMNGMDDEDVGREAKNSEATDGST